MTSKTWCPAMMTFLLLFSTLHLLFWSSSSLALSDSSSSINKDQAKADKASLTKGESHVQPDPKFKELIDKYRATITALDRTIDDIRMVTVSANLTLTIRVDLLLSLGVPIERADELETKLKRVWDKWCAIATDDFGPGLLTITKKALKDFERVPSQDSQSELESSVAALEAAVAPLEPILKGQPLWNFDGWLEHQDMTLYAAVYQDTVDTFVKVLDCEPDAEEAVNKVLQHLREVNLYSPVVTLSPRAKWSRAFDKWFPRIAVGTVGLVGLSYAIYKVGMLIYGNRTTDETTSDIYQTIESITSDEPITIYTDHISETIDDYGRTVVVALVICVLLVLATGVGLYYFLVNRNRKPTKDTNLEANKSTKRSSSSSSSPAGDGSSSKPYSKRS